MTCVLVKRRDLDMETDTHRGGQCQDTGRIHSEKTSTCQRERPETSPFTHSPQKELILPTT